MSLWRTTRDRTTALAVLSGVSISFASCNGSSSGSVRKAEPSAHTPSAPDAAASAQDDFAEAAAPMTQLDSSVRASPDAGSDVPLSDGSSRTPADYLCISADPGVTASSETWACGPPVALPIEEGPAALGGCGPTDLPDGTEYWLPNAEQSRVVTERLPAFIDAVTSELPKALSEYCMQHTGFSFAGRDFINVNAYATGDARPQTTAVGLCDGGALSWDAGFSLSDDCFVYFLSGSYGVK